MISDTLSDAVFDIKDYLRDFPEVYFGMEDEIANVLAAMDALRAKLDAPPAIETA